MAATWSSLSWARNAGINTPTCFVERLTPCRITIARLLASLAPTAELWINDGYAPGALAPTPWPVQPWQLAQLAMNICAPFTALIVVPRSAVTSLAGLPHWSRGRVSPPLVGGTERRYVTIEPRSSRTRYCVLSVTTFAIGPAT